MKYSNTTHRFLLLLFPFLLTGCYTQFQTYDNFPLEKDRYAGYYAWDGFEKAEPAPEKHTENQEQAYNNNDKYYSEEDSLNEELLLEMNDIYFQDFETKRWYQEHYANQLFWEGYAEGYDDGYYDGWNSHYPYSARYSTNRHRYFYGYTGAYQYYSFYHYPAYIWFNYGGFPYVTFYTGFYGHWGFYDPFYSPYWGHPYYSYYGYYYGPYYGYAHAYNYYHRNIRYGRSADIYRTGPRNSGFADKSGDRNRPGLDRDTNARGSGVTRTRTNNNGLGVRGPGSSISRGSSGRLGRDNNGSRGSSIGKGITNPGNGRSRGSESSVGNGRSSSGGDDARTRGSDSKSNLNNRTTRSYDIGSLGDKERIYTIPTRKVSYPKARSNDRASARRSVFSIPPYTRTYQPYTPGTRISRPTSPGNTTRINNNRSSSTSRPSVKARSSSSSSRSSGTKSRSSSSSSKKGSRGN